MEGTAQTLVNNVGQLLAAEYRQLSGVGGEIAELRDDLNTMNALLRMHSEADDGNVDHFVRVWMKQLREVAYDAEDCIDLYLLRIKCRPGDGMRAKFKHLFGTFLSRRRLVREIGALRARAAAICERHARYGVNREDLRPSPALSAAPMLAASAAPAHQAFSLAKEHAGHRQIIGMEDQVDTLAKRLKASAYAEPLAERARHLKVFSIVGFGGVGKTTLAMEVCRLLEADFPYQAFVSVYQAFEPSRDLKALLKRVLQQIVNTKAARANEKGIKEEGSLGNIDSLDSQQLAKEVQERLKNKRYLIVIDDAWSIRAWEAIQSVLPENNFDSRIIVTTRLETVAQACSSASASGRFVHHMQPLELHASKRLFLSRVFGSTDASYPEELEEVMGNILKKCGGLPLAVISIASILVGYKSSGNIDKWDMVCRSIGSQMESNTTLEGMRQIVTLSFNHLPHELKGCMMYFSIFPEDYAIKKDRLLCRWIAEGLISEKRGLTLMEVAESYFDELLCRNMIEEDRIYTSSLNSWYRVHDMLLEVMVSRSLEANFVSLQGGAYNGLSYAKMRRLSIHGTVNSTNSAPMRKVDEVINVQYVRSFSIFQLQGHKLLDQLDKFTLLRVLDLEGCEGVTNKHVRYACQLRLLKFLSMQGTNITVLPAQIGNLEHLQVLNVYHTLLDDLPETITKLERLEVLSFSNKKKYFDNMWKLPRGISKMKALRHVGVPRLGNDAEAAREVGELEHLQEIDIYVGHETSSEDVLQEIALSLSKRYSLRKLCIGVLKSENKIMNFLHRVPTPPRLLRTLFISGEMDYLPSWIGSLTYLVNFTVFRTVLDSEQLFGALCALPNLKILNVAWKRYNNHEIVVRTSYKFPMLSYLWFAGGLPRVIRFELGSMEKLEYFELNIRSRQSDITIIGIEYLINLKRVTFISGKNYPALNLVLEQMKAANERRHKCNQFQVAVKYDDSL